MHRAVRTTAILSGLLLTSAILGSAARADVGASGTRLSVAGGAPRFYMTYGHIEEPELYAPIIPELRRVGVMFQRVGDDYAVFARGKEVGRWPIARSREDVPETGEHPCVLLMGGNVFVPVRQIASLAGLNIQWQKRDNVVAVLPGDQKRPRVTQAAGPITLTGVKLEQRNGGLVLSVQSTSPIRPKWLTVKAAPARVVLDFPGARWADGLTLPNSAGDVKALRTGYFEGKTARLVLEVPSGETRITRVDVAKDQVTARVGQGTEARAPIMSPDAEAQIRMALESRNGFGPGGSRGADFPLTPLDPGVQPEDPSVPPIERPDFLPGIPARSLVGHTIVLDAGHGGHDVGAKGTMSHEADLCLQMVLQFKRSLEARGANVILTRSTDDFVSLEQRCQIANNSGAELFIAIHCNSMPRPNTARGSEAYYYTSQSQRLAHLLHRRVVQAVRGHDGGVRNHRRLFVCRNTQMPSVLLEIGFINSVEDEQLLTDNAFHGRLAESLTKGVLDYFGTNDREASGR